MQLRGWTEGTITRGPKLACGCGQGETMLLLYSPSQVIKHKNQHFELGTKLNRYQKQLFQNSALVEAHTSQQTSSHILHSLGRPCCPLWQAPFNPLPLSLTVALHSVSFGYAVRRDIVVLRDTILANRSLFLPRIFLAQADI